MRIISIKDVATEAEYDQAIVEINGLLHKGEANLSPEEGVPSVGWRAFEKKVRIGR